MDIRIQHQPEQNRFAAVVGDDVVGIAGYERRDGVIVLTHTVVERAVEGQGVGSALARTALDTARAEGRHVVPVCPFMDAWIRRHAQYADLVVAPPQE
ncbi:MAG TPA: GNAT family N-acetyltransferase [Actinomycetaceae bacterium]|nr:GNAT family N-acetyltransferase [Actinomycetaceae bacterium]